MEGEEEVWVDELSLGDLRWTRLSLWGWGWIGGFFIVFARGLLLSLTSR